MKSPLLAVYRVRGVIYAMSIAVLVAIALTSGRIPLLTDLQLILVPISVVAAAGIAVSVALIFGRSGIVPRSETTGVATPVRGRWLGMNSPVTKVPSHGIHMYGQTYAIDLVHEPLDAERPAFGVGPAMRKAVNYTAFGQPVYAMINGTVVRATDWRRDHRARSSALSVVYMLVEGMIRELGGPSFILGNHVTIRGASGEYAVVAHLQQGSVTARIGTTVRAGEQIARCGNSGNSSEPHVHAQLMDQISPWTAQGLPMVFTNITLDEGSEFADVLPGTGQYMTTIAGPEPAPE